MAAIEQLSEKLHQGVRRNIRHRIRGPGAANFQTALGLREAQPQKGVWPCSFAKDHDYFVGETGFLVHNAGPCGCDYYRPYIQQWVRDAVEEAQEYTEDGLRIDPNTGIPYAGPPHLGHAPGFEWWRIRDMAEREGLTQQELNELVQDPDLYQYENPISNMSHACEIP